MNQRRTWRALALGFVVASLAACGGNGGDSDTGLVRVVNATLNHASIDMLVNTASAIPGTAKDSASAYVGVASGSPILQINDAGSSTGLTSLAPTVAKDLHYSILVYETGGAVKTTVLNDDNVLPTAGSAELRVLDLASDAGALDVYVTAPTTDLSTVSATASVSSTATLSSFLTFTAGTYRVRVTGSGNVNDLRLDIPSITLTSQQLHTVLLTSSVGGVLVDGGTLVQQGTYTATRNTNARVRLAAAVAGSASVGATSGSLVINAPTTSPAVGSYAVVPANTAIAVNVNGASFPVPGTGLAAGSDSTLLVYGTAAAPVVSVVADDNHVPASTTTLKMRLVNGITGTVTPLTLTADFGVVASNVQPGTASGYGIVTGNTTMRLDVTSPSSLTALYSESNLNIPAASVFTLFMLGDSAAPSHVLRRDR